VGAVARRQPARVRGTGDADDPGILRIDFPGGAGEDSLEPISWEEWVEKFNESNLGRPARGGRRMRVAMVSEHASPLATLGGVDAGGQNVHVAALAKAVARRGAQV
jgi:hypothetical protein